MTYLNAALRSRINQTAHAQAILFEVKYREKLTELISQKIEGGESLNDIVALLESIKSNPLALTENLMP